jgi:hypothetical protein
MTPQETLRLARARGITIEVAGEKLRIAPAGAVDSALREALAAHKAELLRLLGPTLDGSGLPIHQCAFCGCPSWWTWDASPGWHCASCTPRPEPFMQGRSVVVAGGEWLMH